MSQSESRSETTRMIAAFNRNVVISAQAASPVKAKIAQELLIAQAIEIQDRASALQEQIDRCWSFLDDHPLHDQYDVLDAQVADMVEEYTDMISALAENETRWFRRRRDPVRGVDDVILTPESVEAHNAVRAWNEKVYADAKSRRENPPKKKATKRKRRETESNNGLTSMHHPDPEDAVMSGV